MPVIIDGHNLLWLIQDDGKDSEPVSDVGLCRILGGYLNLIGQEGQIVFDGTGPPDKSGFDNIRNLEVSFAGLATDADSVIEDKIRASTAPKRLTIVSSDRRLRDAARTRKAVSVKSDVFWKDVHKRLRRKRVVQEPTEKRTGVSESETEEWLKFFGFEE